MKTTRKHNPIAVALAGGLLAGLLGTSDARAVGRIRTGAGAWRI
jgi:hypothetical protein